MYRSILLSALAVAACTASTAPDTPAPTTEAPASDAPATQATSSAAALAAARFASSDELATVLRNTAALRELPQGDARRGELEAQNAEMFARVRAEFPELARAENKALVTEAVRGASVARLPLYASPCTDGCQQTLAVDMGFCLLLSETVIGFALCAAAATASNISCISSCDSNLSR